MACVTCITCRTCRKCNSAVPALSLQTLPLRLFEYNKPGALVRLPSFLVTAPSPARRSAPHRLAPHRSAPLRIAPTVYVVTGSGNRSDIGGA